jgi:hypothetical protein
VAIDRERPAARGLRAAMVDDGAEHGVGVQAGDQGSVVLPANGGYTPNTTPCMMSVIPSARRTRGVRAVDLAPVVPGACLARKWQVGLLPAMGEQTVTFGNRDTWCAVFAERPGLDNVLRYPFRQTAKSRLKVVVRLFVWTNRAWSGSMR